MKDLQLKRGSATKVSEYRGAEGELVVISGQWNLTVHDNVTDGGQLLSPSAIQFIDVPTGISPVFNFDNSITPTLTASSFVTLPAGVDTHVSSEWQIATDASFNDIVLSATVDTGDLTELSLNGLHELDYNVRYYWRVRYSGDILLESPWSETYWFETELLGVINNPTIVSPNNSVINAEITNLVLTASAFSTDPVDVDTVLKSEWQIATDSSFNNLVAIEEVLSDNFSTVTITDELDYDTVYYWRMRYIGNLLGESNWTIPTYFRTRVEGSVNKPVNSTPSNNAIDVGLNKDAGSQANIAFIASAFSTTPEGMDTPLRSEWQIATNSTFTTGLITQSKSTSTSSLLLALPVTGNTYYWRMRYIGNELGNSDWSDVTSFTMAERNFNLISAEANFIDAYIRLNGNTWFLYINCDITVKGTSSDIRRIMARMRFNQSDGGTDFFNYIDRDISVNEFNSSSGAIHETRFYRLGSDISEAEARSRIPSIALLNVQYNAFVSVSASQSISLRFDAASRDINIQLPPAQNIPTQ